MLKHKHIKSFLPVFSGFYESIFAPDEELVIEEPFNYDDYEFDYNGYYLSVAKGCVDAIEDKLVDLFNLSAKDIKIIFEEIHSPKFYNFETDAIYVKYKLTSEAIKAINAYLLENEDAFATYIKERYTSRSGFNSWHSNNHKDWFKEISTKANLSHKFGAILDFILYIENYDAYRLYEDLDGQCYLDGWLKENVATVTDVIASYTKDNYLNKDVPTITAELLEYFEANEIDGDFLTYNYVEKYVIEGFNEIENKTLNLFAQLK